MNDTPHVEERQSLGRRFTGRLVSFVGGAATGYIGLELAGANTQFSIAGGIIGGLALSHEVHRTLQQIEVLRQDTPTE